MKSGQTVTTEPDFTITKMKQDSKINQIKAKGKLWTMVTNNSQNKNVLWKIVTMVTNNKTDKTTMQYS